MQRRRTFNDPGHAHELTFSTYRKTKLFEESSAGRPGKVLTVASDMGANGRCSLSYAERVGPVSPMPPAAGADAAGMGWRSDPSLDAAADYQDGETYYDGSVDSVLGRSKDLWYQFVQPERIDLNHSSPFTWDASQAKDILYDNGTSPTVTLETNTALVPRGSRVRLFNLNSPGQTITVKVGTTTIDTIIASRMSEFLFYVDGSGNGKWLALHKDTVTGVF